MTTIGKIRTNNENATTASERSHALGVSGIREIYEKALTIPDVIRLEFGEPDFDTPQNIKDAAIRAIREGKTKYTSSAGLIELRRVISRKLEKENGIYYDPKSEIVVTAGSTAALNVALVSTLDVGDEVLIPNPGWASYMHAVQLVGAKPVMYPLKESNDYRFEREEAEKLVTSRTKALLINSPSNPIGSVFSGRDLEEVADLAQTHDLFVLSDEVYEKFVYGTDGQQQQQISIAKLPDMRDRTVTINSTSKTYAMTGWRVGYAASNSDIGEAMTKVNSAAASCVSAVSQYAAIEAFGGPQDSVREMISVYQKRRNAIVKRLNEVSGFSCPMPSGAFYAFPNISGTGLSSFKLAMKILEQAHVATVPGSAFGDEGEGYLRLAYANSMENIELGLDRISKVTG